MSPKKTDYQDRKNLILGIVVNEYIRAVNPISSAFIVQEYSLDLSPATIRNILAELEEEEYLTHPHTSAGRVPTENGYRYYVDYLMNEIQLLEEEKKRIKGEYERQIHNLEGILEKTSQAISDLTHYTSIVSVDGDDRIYCKGTSFIVSYHDYHDLNKIRDILITLGEKERILDIINRDLQQKIKIYIGHELACSSIEDCSLAVSSYRVNKGLSGRLAVLGPTRMDYPRVVSALDYVSKLMNEILL